MNTCCYEIYAYYRKSAPVRTLVDGEATLRIVLSETLGQDEDLVAITVGAIDEEDGGVNSTLVWVTGEGFLVNSFPYWLCEAVESSLIIPKNVIEPDGSAAFINEEHRKIHNHLRKLSPVQ